MNHSVSSGAMFEGRYPPTENSLYVDESRLCMGRNLPNAMTVDVEDYFQVSAFDGLISRTDWSDIPSRLPQNIDRILELFESENVKATFFTLGWVCQKMPELVRDIAAAGHEIASHGHDHARVWTFDRDRFLEDAEGSRKRLEDISGTRVVGYRAPSFSIGQETPWAHDVLLEAGYTYSSSIYPIRHDHYGLPNAPRFPFRFETGGLLEIPLSSVRVFGRNWPCAGGGYFRLLPLAYSSWAVRRVNNKENLPTVFYFHPWEIDPEQPRIPGASAKTRFRHYTNLDVFESRLTAMLRCFRWDRMDRVYLR